MCKKLLTLVMLGFITLLTLPVDSTAGGVSKDVKSVAIVSFTANNYGLWGSKPMDAKLIEDNIVSMLNSTETTLGQYWKVKPASDFVAKPAYRKLTIGKVKDGLVAPTLGGKIMPTFSEVKKEIIKGILKTETAKQLCATLGVDAVALIYSEWTIKTGRFVPTTKALTKNCVAMYDKNGKKLFYARKDVVGKKTIGGAFAGVHINEKTIDQWVTAYNTGITYIFKKNH